MNAVSYYETHKSAMRTLNRTVAMLTQGVSYTETVDCEGFKLRVYIESDTYASQCQAHVEVWAMDDLRWNRLAMIPYSEMQTKAKLAYLPDGAGRNEAHFKQDRDTLLAQAMAVLDLHHAQWASNPAVAAFIQADVEGDGFDLRVTTVDGAVLVGPCSPPTERELPIVPRKADGSDGAGESIPLDAIAAAEIVW